MKQPTFHCFTYSRHCTLYTIVHYINFILFYKCNTSALLHFRLEQYKYYIVYYYSSINHNTIELYTIHSLLLYNTLFVYTCLYLFISIVSVFHCVSSLNIDVKF